MNAMLSFNLPEEAVEHQDALNGTDWRLVAYNLDNMLRNAIAIGHSLKTADEALAEVRKYLHKEVSDRNLSL